MSRRSFVSACAGLLGTACSSSAFAAATEPSGRIAFVRGDFGHANDRKIWIVNADGTGLRPLTKNDNSPGEDNPTWSPNGKLIAFSALRKGTKRIFFQDLEGRFEQCITGDMSNAEAPAWSPDGSKIAFTVWPEGRKESHIYVMRSDGSNKQQLTHGKGRYDWMPCWTEDNEIVFESTRDGNRELYRIKANGTGLLRVTTHPATDHAPACSPNDSKVAFMAGRDFGNAEICVTKLDGTELVNLTKHAGRDSEPSWSRDGHWIAFTRSKGRPAPMDIWIMKADGGDQRNLTQSPNGVYNWAPSWGP